MGDYPPHGPGPGGFLTKGSSTYHWEESPDITVQDLGVSTYGDGYAGFGVLKDAGICD